MLGKPVPEEKNFELNSLQNGEPMEVVEDRAYVVPGGRLLEGFGCGEGERWV